MSSHACCVLFPRAAQLECGSLTALTLLTFCHVRTAVACVSRDVSMPTVQVKGLQSVIDEISSPDSFYFDGTGVLRRVTSSIFDDRGNIAQREAAKKKRQERFRLRKGEAEARRTALRLKVVIYTREDFDVWEARASTRKTGVVARRSKAARGVKPYPFRAKYSVCRKLTI